MSAKQRFDALFGPDSPDTRDLPKELRGQVYSRFRLAFAEEDKTALRKVRRLFMGTFHTDRKNFVFSKSECQAVFSTIDELFSDKTN